MTRAEIIVAVEAAYGLESATVLAAEHGITRNAVIGIWNRGRQAGRVGLGASSPVRPSKVLVGVVGAAKAYVEADPDGSRTCRWPIGDPRDPDFRFCGEVVTTPTVPSADGRGRPNLYCEACRALSLGVRVDKFRPPVLGHAAFSAPREVKAGAVRHGRASA